MFADVHVHLDNRRFDEDRHDVIVTARKSGAEILINSGSSLASSKRSVDLADKYDYIYACVGVHPHETEKTPENTLDILSELAKNKKVVAIGEIGLDYYYEYSGRETQKIWFIKQMELAADLGLPVVIHDRDAHADCLEIAKMFAGKIKKGIFHCYSGSVEYSKEIIKLGYSMSFGGIVTFSNAKTCKEVVKSLPVEHILTETDAPFLAPAPFRGKRNDSSLVPYIIDEIAVLKNMTPEDISRITIENAKRIFEI